jgi:Kef-type K+ transport system membrane component KefB
MARWNPQFESTEAVAPRAAAPRLTWVGVAGYLALLAAGVGAFFLIRALGEGLSTTPAPAGTPPVGRAMPGEVDVVLHVTATLAAVIALGAALSRVLRYLGQPPVIGEVIAGILLGPSLLGAISPEALHRLIPSPESDPHGRVPAALKAVSQLGVIIYMFLVGLELNATRMAKRAHAAVAVSHAGIVLPFVLGSALAIGLYPIYSHDGVPFTSFAMFMGVAMAITAFPVLARILTDRGLDKTEIGGIALGCAAADDVSAWCLLALVVGVAQADLGSGARVVGGAIVFIAFMILTVRPLMRRATRVWDRQTGPLPKQAIAFIFVAVLLSALATEAIGVHAVFGAFLLGAVIPHDSRIAHEFTKQLTQIVTILFLPAFFAFTGMRMQIGLISGWESWLWCAAIIAIATVGKFGATLVAGRLTGLSWRDSAVLGTLMNTRGLMELIVLNIGLDLGVISPTLFAMMVVMALVTTALTAPVLQWLMPVASHHPAPSESVLRQAGGAR